MGRVFAGAESVCDVDGTELVPQPYTIEGHDRMDDVISTWSSISSHLASV